MEGDTRRKAEDGEKVVVRQVRSEIGRDQRTKDTLRALGLGRIGREREFTVNPALRGMFRKVFHLVKIYPAAK